MVGIFNGKGRTKDECKQNPDTGEVLCRRVRVNADGTEVDLAGFSMEVSASCDPVLSNVYDNEDGQLEGLQKKFVPNIIAKCKNRPADY